jgi:hypothetical protein
MVGEPAMAVWPYLRVVALGEGDAQDARRHHGIVAEVS